MNVSTQPAQAISPQVTVPNEPPASVKRLVRQREERCAGWLAFVGNAENAYPLGKWTCHQD